MKKIFDVIFSDFSNPQAAKKNQHCDSSQSFYQCGKASKTIIEPERFSVDSFSEYSCEDHYTSLKKLLTKKNDNDIFTILEENNLGGCGGADFPVVKKWRAVKANQGQRYLIVNGMEGELYTFKDYMLMKHYPRILVEGATIAALSVEAKEVIFVVNSAYQVCIENVKRAIDDLYNQLPEIKDIKFNIVEGPTPDLYVLGEETALIEYLENRRGEPQLKPPFPFQQGYKNEPTLVQNVETLAWLPILLKRPDLFVEHGRRKLVSINGAVNCPGIYEASIGKNIQELLKMAGGLRENSELQAIEVGGLAGGLLPPYYLNQAYDYEVMKTFGAMIGTGSINFLDQDNCLIDTVLRGMEFFREESCGRCTPCRVGTHELLRVATVLAERDLSDETLEWLEDVSQTMINTSTCGLGKGAPSILMSLLRYWQIHNGKVSLIDKKRVENTYSLLANNA